MDHEVAYRESKSARKFENHRRSHHRAIYHAIVTNVGPARKRLGITIIRANNQTTCLTNSPNTLLQSSITIYYLSRKLDKLRFYNEVSGLRTTGLSAYFA